MVIVIQSATTANLIVRHGIFHDQQHDPLLSLQSSWTMTMNTTVKQGEIS